MTEEATATLRVPYNERRPVTEANYVIRETARLFSESSGGRYSAEYFTTEYVAELDFADAGETLFRRATGHANKEVKLLWYMLAACGFALDAMRAGAAGESESVTWAYVAEANWMLGLVTAIVTYNTHPQAMARVIAQRGGKQAGAARVKKAAAEKKALRDWCEGKHDEYATQKALVDDAITAGIVKDRGRDTIADWIEEFVKEWRAAGTWKGR